MIFCIGTKEEHKDCIATKMGLDNYRAGMLKMYADTRTQKRNVPVEIFTVTATGIGQHFEIFEECGRFSATRRVRTVACRLLENAADRFDSDAYMVISDDGYEVRSTTGMLFSITMKQRWVDTL